VALLFEVDPTVVILSSGPSKTASPAQALRQLGLFNGLGALMQIYVIHKNARFAAGISICGWFIA
jgi:hypothetical protein